MCSVSLHAQLSNTAKPIRTHQACGAAQCEITPPTGLVTMQQWYVPEPVRLSEAAICCEIMAVVATPTLLQTLCEHVEEATC